MFNVLSYTQGCMFYIPPPLGEIMLKFAKKKCFSLNQQWAKKYNFGKSGGWKIEFPCKIYTPAYTYLC